MLQVDITIRDDITTMTKRIRTELRRYPVEAEAEFVRLTPIRRGPLGGNARRNTKLVGNSEIHANYQYADVLDAGRHMTTKGMRGSTQAPKGMTKPFLDWAKKKIAYIFRKR